MAHGRGLPRARAARRPAGAPAAFAEAPVDWGRTRAWGEGGYYCRLSVNLAGREPRGAVAPEEYEGLLAELAERLAQIPGPDGEPIGTRVFRPRELWREQRGIAPDLVVYFGDLGWRSNGSLGHARHWTFENDTGPDDANHDRHGICVIAGPGVPEGRREDLSILDIAPTILAQAGLSDTAQAPPRQDHPAESGLARPEPQAPRGRVLTAPAMR